MSRERSNGFLNLSVQKKLWFAAAAAAYTVLFLWLSVYDLPFSDFLTAHASEWFFQLGRRIGQLPAPLIPAFCIHALSSFNTRKWYIEIICFLLCFIAAWTIVIPHDSFFVEGCVTLAAAIVIFLILIRIPLPKDTPSSRRLLWIGIMTPLIGIVIVEVIKYVWNRPRYLAILQEGAQFQNWRTINGFAIKSDLYHSFPSAHTFDAACSFLIVLLPELYEEYPWNSSLLFAGPLVFTVFVAVSRIMGGMHFISDVMAGAAIFAIVFISLLYRNSRHAKQDFE